MAIDTFVESMPAAMRDGESGIEVAADGGVSIGAEFRRLEAAWMTGVAATARAGAPVIIDDVFLGGRGPAALKDPFGTLRRPEGVLHGVRRRTGRGA